MVEKHLDICNIIPLSQIKARAVIWELLFKLFIKRNAGSSLLSPSPECEMPEPNLLPDLQFCPTKQIPKAQMSVCAAADL